MEHLIKLKEVITDRYSNKYDVKFPKLAKPKLKIIGADQNYSNEELKRALIAQNHFISADDKLNIVHSIKMKNNAWILVVETNGDTLKRILEKGWINLGWKECKVIEDIYIYIRQCKLCFRFDHESNECKHEMVCVFCGQTHSGKNCKSTLLQCVNCKYNNHKFQENLNTEHRADNT